MRECVYVLFNALNLETLGVFVCVCKFKHSADSASHAGVEVLLMMHLYTHGCRKSPFDQEHTHYTSMYVSFLTFVTELG